MELHTFGDASGSGISAVVYAVVKQPSGVSVGLVAAKSRLAKKNLTIPRLKLVSGHMAANLVGNVRTAFSGYPVRAVFGWLDSRSSRPPLDQGRRNIQEIRFQQGEENQREGFHCMATCWH